MQSAHSEWVGLVDGHRFLGWVHADALSNGRALREVPAEMPAASLSPDSTLRTAMDLIMATDTSVAVIDDGGRFGGVVTLEQIREGLRVPVDRGLPVDHGAPDA